MTFPSLYYFFYYAALSFFLPFLALVYKSHGLSGAQIGLLAAFSPIVAFFGAQLWTIGADVTHRHKAALVLSMLGLVAVGCLFPSATTFGGLLLLVCCYSFFYSPVASLVDSAVLVLLGDHRERYGRIRLWGTVGYGLVAPAAALVIGRYGLDWSFWGFAIFTAASLLAVLPVPFHQARSNGSFFVGMRHLFNNRPWMLFLVMVFIAAAGMSTINNYLFLYMQSLGASSALMGSALTVSTFSEIPVLFFSDRLLRRFNARGMLVIAMTVIGLRLLCYSFTALPWTVLLIQLVHGFTYAIMYTAGVHFADQAAPPGMKATAQGMFGGTLAGFGSAAGGLLGGLLLDRFSPSGMYAVMGSLVLAGLIVFLFFERRLAQKNGV